MKRILLSAIACICWTMNAMGQMSDRVGATLADGSLEGTDAVGHAIAAYALGTLPDDGHTIFAYWSSEDWGGITTLGYGWRIPLFESRIFPDSMDSLVMYGPEGNRAKFLRTNKKDPNVYQGRHGSGCIVKGSEIRYYQKLKDKKQPNLIFRNGRLAAINGNNGKSLEIHYSADGVFERLTCGGKVLCRMKVDGKDGRIRKFEFATGSRVECLLGLVRIAGLGSGERVRLAERSSVIQLKIGERLHRITHGLTKDGKAMFTGGDRTYTYDPKSRLLLSLNDWTYTITEVDPLRRTAHFVRRRSDGETEEEYVNEKTGMRIRERKGWRHVWRVFTSGKNLYGRRRWMEEFYPQGYGSRTEYTYDEKGVLLMTRKTNRKSGETIDTRFTAAGRVGYFKITQKGGGFLEYWLDVKDGRLLRTMKNGDGQSVCDYLYASNGTRVACLRQGKVVSRFVPNADEFVRWYADVEKGVKRPAPRVKTTAEVERENARNTEFLVLWTYPETSAFDLARLKAADTPKKMSEALESFYEGLYLRPEVRYGIDILDDSGKRKHHLVIDAIKKRGVDLEMGHWRVVQPNVQIMELTDELRYRILPEGSFEKRTNDLHLVALIYPESAMLAVEGRVVDVRGSPLGGVRVKATFLPKFDLVSYPELMTETDCEGRYRFANVPPVRIQQLLSYLARGCFGEVRTGGLYEGVHSISIEVGDTVRTKVGLISERNAKFAAEVVSLLRDQRNLLEEKHQKLLEGEACPELPKSRGGVVFVPDLVLKK